MRAAVASSYALFALALAHRRFCASAIRRRASALSLRFLRAVGADAAAGASVAAAAAPRADPRSLRACDSSSWRRCRVVAISCSRPCRAHVSSSRLPLAKPVFTDLRDFAMKHAPRGEKRSYLCASIARFLPLVVIFLLLSASNIAGQDTNFDARLDRAYARAYNLDHDDAVRELDELAKVAPDLPATYRALASITWLRLLFSRGTVLVDEYLGRIARHDVQMTSVDPEITGTFTRYVTRATALAETRVQTHPRDARAHYDLSSAVGLQASWAATVEGRMGRAFGAARRAYKSAERAAELAPDDPDPRLILGTYRYVVAGLNLPARWVAYIAGLDGDRARGLQLIEQAATSASPVRTEARFALILLYNREKRWDDALGVLAQLRAAYPRNRLLWLETGATALRAGRHADALRWLDEGLALAARDARRRMFGEAALWRLKRTQALRALGRNADARQDALAGLAEADARDWVRGRTHLELSELELALGNRDQARWQALKAVPLLERGADPEGARRARLLLERMGRG